MSTLTIAELITDAERAFRAELGDSFVATSRETFFESSFRGGFQLILSDSKNRCEVLYSDMELEVRCNGREVFGVTVHADFEGNTFTREHLREYLARIAASAAVTARTRDALG